MGTRNALTVLGLNRKGQTEDFTITPLNENQELNYWESAEYDFGGVIARAQKLRADLQAALPLADIGVAINRADGSASRLIVWEEDKITDDDGNICLAKNE